MVRVGLAIVVAWAVSACGGYEQAVMNSSGSPDDDDGSTSAATDGSGDDSATVGAEGETSNVDSSGGPPPPPDDTTTGGPVDTDTTGEPPPVGQNGTYEGMVSITVSPSGWEPFACSGAVTFQVVEASPVPITGSGTCILPVTGTPVEAMFSGTLGPPANGQVFFDVPSAGISEMTTWTGQFSGDVFTGEFSGTTVFMSSSTNYSGNWTVMR